MWFQQLFGDTRSFALAVALEEDPGPASDMPESLRKSWGTLAIHANGRCLTRNTTDGRVSDAVHWYLRSFVEWLDANAVRLLNEEPYPGLPPDHEIVDAIDWLEATVDGPVLSRTEQEEDRWFEERSRWQECRSLRQGLPGGVAPFLIFRRLGDHIEISWDNDRRPPTRPGVRFVESRGAVTVSAAHVAAVFRDVVRGVSAHLAESGGFALGGPLANGASPDEDAWRWLVHPVSRKLFDDPGLHRERQQLRAEMKTHGALVSHSLTTALLRAVSATQVAQLRPFLQVGKATSLGAALAPPLVSERSAPPTSVREAWNAGYERARQLQRTLGWSAQPPPLGQALPSLGLEVRDTELVDGVQCAVADVGARRVTAVISTRPGMRRSMRLATALGHVLFDVQTDHPFGVVSGPWSHAPSNARAKAFGAMLLMPEDEVRRMARDHGGVDASLVTAVMKRFDTGLAATTWHLYHLRLVSDEGRMALIKDVRENLD
jgi:hypothetical protein